MRTFLTEAALQNISCHVLGVYTGFGLVTGFIGHFDTTRDYLHFPDHSHTH
jgi:hypothetical protein